VSILIVDDDDDARDMLSLVLARSGYTVATARNGREALDMLHTIRPEMILLDVCMPVMDGAQFRQEQRRNREWIRIPTVVMTGAAEEPVLDVAVELALRKPVTSQQLLSIVARHATPKASDPI
jgi:CheY-like chemotaxis protein